jgi:hypothetical protein
VPELLARQEAGVGKFDLPMNMHGRFATTELMVSGAEAPPRPPSLGLLCARLASWVKTLADYYAAAATYEQLSRFSDGELKHRGLSRDVLARDLSEVAMHVPPIEIEIHLTR